MGETRDRRTQFKQHGRAATTISQMREIRSYGGVQLRKQKRDVILVKRRGLVITDYNAVSFSVVLIIFSRLGFENASTDRSGHD
jgi:hypothetical protein